MKKLTIAVITVGTSSLLLAGQVHATVAYACNNGVAVMVPGSASSYEKEDFTPKCSNAVTLQYEDQVTQVVAKSGSAKGMHTFGGSSFTGSVFQCESSSVASPDTLTTPGVDGC